MFADDERPPVWHVVPERPRLGLLDDGRPTCLLVKYRMDLSRDWPRGGGLLLLQCELRPSNQSLAEARTVLIAQPDPLQNIVPLQPDRATCELLLWQGDIASQSIVTATPSVEPPFGASFQVALTMQAVTVFEEALKTGHSPATLTYRLSVNTRRPSLPATVTLDWRRISETIADTGSTNIQKLIQLDAIRIEIAPLDDDVAAVQRVTERVVEEASHLVATRLPTAEPRTTARFDLSQPREEETVIVACATFTQLLDGLGPKGRPESLVALMEEMRG
jgi:hypothetical protein